MTAALTERPDTWADVEAARDGDRAAFGLIWQAHHMAVFTFVHRRVPLRADAEEITSDTFLRALQRINGIEWQGRDIRAWLHTIARNLIFDHYKCARVRTTSPCGDMNGHDWADPTDLADEAAAASADRWLEARLWWAVAELLTPPQRQCIHLRYAYGLTVAETAAVMGCEEGAVKALAWRAIQSLRRALALTDLVAVPRQRVTPEGVRAA